MVFYVFVDGHEIFISDCTEIVVFLFLDKYWFCCLSPNHRFLHYIGDLTSTDTPPSIDSLPDKCKTRLSILLFVDASIPCSKFTNYSV